MERSKELEEVYKVYGICARYCSHIEYGMTLLLHPTAWEKYGEDVHQKMQKCIEQVGDPSNINVAIADYDKAVEKLDRCIEGLYRNTLKTLIDEMKAYYEISDKQVEFINEIRLKRNYMTHHMWGKYSIWGMDEKRGKEMLEELNELRKFFELAYNWVWSQVSFTRGTSAVWRDKTKIMNICAGKTGTRLALDEDPRWQDLGYLTRGTRQV